MPVSPSAVLLVTPRWTRDGGVATHVMTSAEVLARRGVAVHVIAARLESDEPVAGVSVRRAPQLFKLGAPPEVRLGELPGGVEVIHLHQVDDPDLVKLLRRSAPVVISAHGYTACTSGVHYFRPGQECTRAHGPGCIPNLLLRGCAHARDPRPLPASYRQAGRGLAALMLADLAISYSSAVDRHLAANGVESHRVVPLFSTMQPRSGEGHEGRRRVVFAGRVVTPKGVDVLIRAAADVDGEFVICGDGLQLQAMRRLAQELGVAGRVIFRGWLGPGELAQELADASVVAMPSVWPEPFGLVGIEALAAGRPVVASSTGGVHDWLQDGVNGLSVRPGDAPALARALNELLSDPARQRQMGEAGRVMVAARFSPAQHFAALLDAYGAARAAWDSGGPDSPAQGARPEPSGV